MDWTLLADGFVAVMQAASGALLVSGAVLWMREGLRGENMDTKTSSSGEPDPQDARTLTGISRG